MHKRSIPQAKYSFTRHLNPTRTTQYENDMSQARIDTLVTIETPTTASFAPSRCTHGTKTPTVVKRMGTIFTGGISGLAEGKPQVLEFQYCFECEPDEWTEDLHLRARLFEPQKPPKSTQTSGLVTPTSPTGSVLGPAVRYRDEKVSPETLFTDAGTIHEEREVSCFSIWSRRR
jgi:hypothetical protein